MQQIDLNLIRKTLSLKAAGLVSVNQVIALEDELVNPIQLLYLGHAVLMMGKKHAPMRSSLSQVGSHTNEPLRNIRIDELFEAQHVNFLSLFTTYVEYFLL